MLQIEDQYKSQLDFYILSMSNLNIKLRNQFSFQMA